MFFKTIILYTLVNVSSLLFIVYFVSGFKISASDGGLFVGLSVFLALLNYFLDPIIKFFTLKIKFLTIWLFGFLITLPVLYFAKVLVTGIEIKSGVFRSLTFGNVQLSSFSMNEIVVVIFAAFILGFGFALIRWLTES